MALATLALAGCGFAPLYAQPGVVKNLAAIDVEAPVGRTGYLIREHLDDTFAKNRAAPAAYRMHLELYETRYPRGIRVDNVASPNLVALADDNQPAVAVQTLAAHDKNEPVVFDITVKKK